MFNNESCPHLPTCSQISFSSISVSVYPLPLSSPFAMMKFILVCLVLAAALQSSLAYQPNLNRNLHMSAQKNNFMDNVKVAFQTIAVKSIPVVMGAALLVANPMESDAASSGGRSGGSSFRGGGGGRSYSAPRSSTRLNSNGGGYGGGYGRGMSIMPMPMYSPFGFSPFGFMPINGDVILLAGAAYVAYTLLSSRAGGSDFGNEGENGALGGGATVVKLQVALDSDWAEAGNIMETLSRLAASKGTITGRSQISNLLTEASVALLRKKSAWSAASIEGERFRGAQKAEPFFQQMAVAERAKFESESTPTYASIQPSTPGTSRPTQAVVSLVVAVRGKSEALRQMRGMTDVAGALQMLASEALTDEGENIMGVELLWTPSDSGSTLSERDLVMDYPELMRL
jgi:uncharacterized membrane protein